MNRASERVRTEGPAVDVRIRCFGPGAISSPGPRRGRESRRGATPLPAHNLPGGHIRRAFRRIEAAPGAALPTRRLRLTAMLRPAAAAAGDASID